MNRGSPRTGELFSSLPAGTANDLAGRILTRAKENKKSFSMDRARSPGDEQVAARRDTSSLTPAPADKKLMQYRCLTDGAFGFRSFPARHSRSTPCRSRRGNLERAVMLSPVNGNGHVPFPTEKWETRTRQRFLCAGRDRAGLRFETGNVGTIRLMSRRAERWMGEFARRTFGSRSWTSPSYRELCWSATAPPPRNISAFRRG